MEEVYIVGAMPTSAMERAWAATAAEAMMAILVNMCELVLLWFY
jgi:hypothetical protein